jgi:hypothetical protein
MAKRTALVELVWVCQRCRVRCLTSATVKRVKCGQCAAWMTRLSVIHWPAGRVTRKEAT